ncbi:hypothetical protein HY745_03780, partial [Candidatus Desantisbacteria bacterium]|nr:hypothetical protein [Candidatus Desantisbacteria bacterium]
CHKNHNAPYKKLLINEGKDLCYLSACHTKFEQKEFIHKPVDDGKCTSCHDPHSSLNKKLLIIKEDVIINTIYRLCYQCHKPFENKPGIHKPVAEGKCDLCHNIHSSDNESLLLNAERQLCESCHLDKSKVKEHARGIEGNKHCTECHDAHYPRQK